MKRKLIKQKSAFTITLPIDWIRENNLENAEEIELTQENNSILISTESKPKNLKKTINLNNGDEHYYRILIENGYLRGIDVLNLNYDDEKVFEIIQNVISNLIGFEIIEQKKYSCLISQTAMPTTDEFEAIIQRLIYLIEYLSQQTLDSINLNSFNNLKKFEKIIADIRKFSLFCRRTIHKQKIVSRTDEVFLDLLLERLVITAYQHYFMYEKLSKLNEKKETKVRKEIIEHYMQSLSLYEKFKKMFFKNNAKEFFEINKIWNKLYMKESQKKFKNCSEKESIILFHSMNHAFEVFLMAQPNTTELYEEIQKLAKK